MPETGIAVLGAGGRGKLLTSHLLACGPDIKVKSVFEPCSDTLRRTLADWPPQHPRICRNYQEAIETPGVDWVLVASPNAFHKEEIVAAFDCGKDVFSEKPLAINIPDCLAIDEAYRRSGRRFGIGFVLRYAPLYRRAKELLAAGEIGDIISISGSENIAPAHGSYMVRSWRRFADIGGPHVLEKCCHDLDLLNWFIGDLPARVAAFGGLNFFTDKYKFLMGKYHRSNGVDVFVNEWEVEQGIEIKSPFEIRKDLMDNLVSILEYRNGVRVQFQTTMSNALPERRMYISGTEGTMVVEAYTSKLLVKRLDEEGFRQMNFAGEGHNGGDQATVDDWYRAIVEQRPPACSGASGVDSSIIALALDQACREKRIVDLEPIWRGLGR